MRNLDEIVVELEQAVREHAGMPLPFHLMMKAQVDRESAVLVLAYAQPIQQIADLLDELMGEEASLLGIQPNDAQEEIIRDAIFMLGSVLLMGGTASLRAKGHKRPARRLLELAIPSNLIKALKEIVDTPDNTPDN